MNTGWEVNSDAGRFSDWEPLSSLLSLPADWSSFCLLGYSIVRRQPFSGDPSWAIGGGEQGGVCTRHVSTLVLETHETILCLLQLQKEPCLYFKTRTRNRPVFQILIRNLPVTFSYFKIMFITKLHGTFNVAVAPFRLGSSLLRTVTITNLLILSSAIPHQYLKLNLLK